MTVLIDDIKLWLLKIMCFKNQPQYNQCDNDVSFFTVL